MVYFGIRKLRQLVQDKRTKQLQQHRSLQKDSEERCPSPVSEQEQELDSMLSEYENFAKNNVMDAVANCTRGLSVLHRKKSRSRSGLQLPAGELKQEQQQQGLIVISEAKNTVNETMGASIPLLQVERIGVQQQQIYPSMAIAGGELLDVPVIQFENASSPRPRVEPSPIPSKILFSASAAASPSVSLAASPRSTPQASPRPPLPLPTMPRFVGIMEASSPSPCRTQAPPTGQVATAVCIHETASSSSSEAASPEQQQQLLQRRKSSVRFSGGQGGGGGPKGNVDSPIIGARRIQQRQVSMSQEPEEHSGSSGGGVEEHEGSSKLLHPSASMYFAARLLHPSKSLGNMIVNRQKASEQFEKQRTVEHVLDKPADDDERRPVTLLGLVKEQIVKESSETHEFLTQICSGKRDPTMLPRAPVTLVMNESMISMAKECSRLGDKSAEQKDFSIFAAKNVVPEVFGCTTSHDRFGLWRFKASKLSPMQQHKIHQRTSAFSKGFPHHGFDISKKLSFALIFAPLTTGADLLTLSEDAQKKLKCRSKCMLVGELHIRVPQVSVLGHRTSEFPFQSSDVRRLAHVTSNSRKVVLEEEVKEYPQKRLPFFVSYTECYIRPQYLVSYELAEAAPRPVRVKDLTAHVTTKKHLLDAKIPFSSIEYTTRWGVPISGVQSLFPGDTWIRHLQSFPNELECTKLEEVLAACRRGSLSIDVADASGSLQYRHSARFEAPPARQYFSS